MKTHESNVESEPGPASLPNFFIVGAQKAGTSSLYQYLKQHPDVFMSPVKEPEFFALEGRSVQHQGPPGCEPNENERPYTDLQAYRELFVDHDGETAIGEASTLYLYSPQAPRRIARHVPEARLIVLLRHLVERTYSAFLMAKRSGDEPLSFEEAIRAEPERIRDDWGYLWRYKDFGFYHRQLQRYVDTFGRDQIKVYLLEDMKRDPEGVMKDLFGFLGVDDTFAPDLSMQHNTGGLPRSTFVQDFMGAESSVLKSAVKRFLPAGVRERIRHQIRDANHHKPSMPPGVRAMLEEEYREDMLRLQDLIGRDLSSWLM